MLFICRPSKVPFLLLCLFCRCVPFSFSRLPSLRSNKRLVCLNCCFHYCATKKQPTRNGKSKTKTKTETHTHTHNRMKRISTYGEIKTNSTNRIQARHNKKAKTNKQTNKQKTKQTIQTTKHKCHRLQHSPYQPTSKTAAITQAHYRPRLVQMLLRFCMWDPAT